MVGLIPIHKEDLFDIKIEIYYQTIGVITKDKCRNKHLSDKFLDLHFWNWPDITALESAIIKYLLIICANENVWQYHAIVIGISVNYKKQVVIIGIKLDIQCSMC